MPESSRPFWTPYRSDSCQAVPAASAGLHMSHKDPKDAQRRRARFGEHPAPLKLLKRSAFFQQVRQAISAMPCLSCEEIATNGIPS